MYALVLAGGKGERLRPLTDTLAKSMVPVNGKPILWHQVSRLVGAGVTDIVILCGYKWTTIQDYFGDGAAFGVRVHYSVEDEPLGRGGALKQGLGLVPASEHTVLALNGDILTTQEFEPLVRLHQQSNALATVMLAPYPSSYGVVEVDRSGRVLAFTEKGDLPYWINAGIYVMDTAIRDQLPDLGDHETTTFPRLAGLGRLYAYQSQAFWRAVDTHKDLREAEEALREANL
ncbi:MAG: nucleotidyltransferase family protein [Dehalococcoidia bacterium]